MVRLERTFDRNADIVGLLLRQGSEFYAELFQVERRDLLVEVLGKDVDVVLVLAALGPELDLGENLVGEGRAHHEARMAGGVAEVNQAACGQDDEIIAGRNRKS